LWTARAAGPPAPDPGADFVLDDPDAALWAPYAPAPSWLIRFDADAATFVRHVFENVTAIGYLHSNANVPPPATGARAGFSVARVRATGRMLGVADAPGVASASAPADLRFAVAPNPAVDGVTLAFTLPARERVRLRVVDVAGRVVASLADGPLAPGAHRVRWDARGVPAGVYVAALEIAGRVESRRLAVLR
jgi:hypothetical protein